MQKLIEALSKEPARLKLVLMPVTRLLIESPVTIGKYHIFPPEYVSLAELRPVPNATLSSGQGDGLISLSGQTLREVKTSITGFGLDVLSESPLIGFVTEINWTEFLSSDHEHDRQLLHECVRNANRAFDILRFDHCRLDIPATLPGRIGSWLEMPGFIGAMIYTLEDHESYLIACESDCPTSVTKGIGLDLFGYEVDDIPDASDGEVSSIAIHALSLFAEVLEAGSETVKFVRAMTLLEFLATPDGFRSWKKLKGDIVCHVAHDKADYHRRCQRFAELTSSESPSGEQTGLRTLVVHHGRYLEEIVPEGSNRALLFRELQEFISGVLSDMLDRPTMSWIQFCEYRLTMKKAMGVA
ncbi:hypothetical protein [Novipirellula rosea]|uniref:Apea-like HEPN domain-containing protein n=1 Tax=Novipirellula rosea TaxID=1031540 RepID=A0ABP8MEW7_9BACT